MRLAQITLTHFKNYTAQELLFNEQLNCLVGKNGMGKTNLLDAIYYLCMGKSYFSWQDAQIMQMEADFFRLEGQFVKEEKKDKVVVKVVPRKKKELERNGKVYAKLSEHIGEFPVVIIAPDDTQLVYEGSEIRRRFLDNTLSQLDQQYLQHLVLYNKVLKQRNALLKQAAGRKISDDLLAVYDEQMLAPATYIHEKRQAFVEQFAAPFQEIHEQISNKAETVAIQYKTALNDKTLDELLMASREKDRILERTSVGIHKDDLVFSMTGRLLKRIASQGQLKTFVLSLKLAQHQFLSTKKETPPILLLDDIFDKLDPLRVKQLMHFVLGQRFGQIFLSDTDPDRVAQLLEGNVSSYALFHIESGKAFNE